MANLGSRVRIFLLVFVITALLLGGNGLFLYRNVEALEAHQKWVTHTYQVISELELVISSLKEAETNQRGFLLKKQGKFLEQYRDSSKAVWTHVQAVKTLTVDNRTQQEQWSLLESSVRDRLRKLQETLEAFQKSNTVSESFVLGQETMEVVRRQADFMISQENTLLNERVQSTVNQRSFLVFSLIGSTLFSILVAFATYLLIRRQTITQAEEDTRRIRENQIKSTEADAAQIAVSEGGVRAIAEALAKYVCERSESLAANLYLETDGVLTLASGYLAGAENFGARVDTARRKSFRLGEGLLGRAATQEGVQILEDIPADYFKIESSFGERAPTCLIIVPVFFQGDRIGVLEIASFKRPSEQQVELLDIIVRASAAGISKGRAQERQQLLLEETQRQAEELQMQQEELRTTNEELEEQAKALTEAQARTQLQTEELRQINEELEQQAKTLEAQQETLSIKNQALETSRKALEDKAKEIERTSAYKSEFMAKMSHELRTPLNSLMILATILQENKKGNLDVQQVEFAKTIYEAGTDLLDLINDILDLSKIEAKKLQVKPETVIVRQFLDQISALFVPQAEARGLKLRVEVDKAVPERFKTDRQRLQQILRNLIGNAMKFTETGTITLHAELISGRIAISVQDTGIGIPPEKIRLIWEAFEQADGSISRRYGGTGLGLTISRELTTLLQGDIGATSESGKGSRFTVQLPLELHADQQGMPIQQPGDAVGAAPAPMMAPPPPIERSEDEVAEDKNERARLVDNLLSNYQVGDRTILVVEDDLKFQTSVAEAVRMQSFKPLVVSDGETALELLKRHTPHAILLDIHLPGINGLALLDVIKKNPAWRGVPIHMISALERQQSALRMGAIGYLGKPVTIDGVRGALQRIESVLERKVKRLLVVEDDSRQRGLIAELLAGADVEIQAIGTGREALEVLKKQGADCVVLDLKLPDMTGFELLESLDSERGLSLPPVIVYTGKDLTREEEDRLRRYSDSIIIKGAKSPERLLDEVSLFIHRIEADMPQDKRAMLTNVRGRDRNFDGRSLLIVDDDLRNLFALTSALEGKGFEISVARDGVEALEKLEAGPKPDLVLMDIMMPRMDGFEAMKRIRNNHKLRDLPIVALTAKAMAGEHERCVQAGASDYLPKPIDLSNLLSVLKVWLPAEGIMS